ncbi:MAG: hypothetical protein V2A62_01435 [Candidatus Woesearchaeota archaeon]
MVFENSIVLGTVKEFIDYAMAVAAILAIVYFVRFLLAVREEKAPDRKVRDAEWEARGAAGREWMGKKYGEMKTKADAAEKKRTEDKEKGVREGKVRLVLSKVTHSYTLSSDLINVLTKVRSSLDKSKRDAALNEAHKLVKEIHDSISNANHVLRRVAHHSKGGEHKFFDDKYSESGVILDMLEDIKNGLPLSTSATWTAEIDCIITKTKGSPGVKVNCDDLISKMNDYIENGKI